MLWSSGFYDTGWQKLAVAKQAQPVVAICGSSRVMQLRSEFFRRVAPADFYNLGGGFGDVYSAMLNIRSMLRLSRPPKLIIFGLDHWWFEQEHEAYYRPPLANSRLEALRQGKLRYLEIYNDISDWITFKMVIFQRAWLSDSFYAFLRSKRRDPLTHRYEYGLNAYRRRLPQRR